MKTRSVFGFIGFGLIGGSVARALRKIYPDSRILAYNYYETKPHPRLEEAVKDGILSNITTSLEDFHHCDVVFLCAPVIKNVAYLQKIAPFVKDDCIITDVGSVKTNIYEEIQELGLDRQFVGGHPMTGSEKIGYNYSDENILIDKYYLLTPTPSTNPDYTSWMEEFVKAAGSLCMILDPVTHDQITSGISHVPHVIAACLVNTVAARDHDGNYAKLAAGGFHSVTRISSSSPEMWENICVTNKTEITRFLDEYIESLNNARQMIESADSEALTNLFSSAKHYRDNIPSGLSDIKPHHPEQQ